MADDEKKGKGEIDVDLTKGGTMAQDFKVPHVTGVRAVSRAPARVLDLSAVARDHEPTVAPTRRTEIELPPSFQELLAEQDAATRAAHTKAPKTVRPEHGVTPDQLASGGQGNATVSLRVVDQERTMRGSMDWTVTRVPDTVYGEPPCVATETDTSALRERLIHAEERAAAWRFSAFAATVAALILFILLVLTRFGMISIPK